MLRKKFAAIAAVATLLLNGTIYPAVGIITKVDYETDTVIVQRASGFEYTFEGVEDLVEGDVMALLMYNDGDPRTIADDEVISARYSGFIASEIQEVGR